MWGFLNGNIVLDDARNIYYAGQVLAGKIEFGLSQPLVFKAINIEFHGEAKVQWREIEVQQYGGQRRTINKDYVANEDYFHVEQLICGGVGVSQLPAGVHSIPFRYQIPSTAPSSFEGSNGKVFYYVKACLEYPGDRVSDELEEAFEVVVPRDMNINPAMKQSICMDFEQVLNGYCCGSGPLTVQVWLPATGFCPGQAVPIQINADNQSSVEIHSIRLELVRRDGYHSKSPVSDQFPPPQLLERSWLGAILPRTKRTINTNFVIPDMIAPVLDNCGIIDVEYYFKVKMKLSGCNEHMEDEVQVYLGLIPVAELVDGVYEHPMKADLPSSPVPNLNAPPVYIQPYIYPSATLENRLHGSNAYPTHQGGGYPNPPRNPPYPGSKPPYPGANSPYPVAGPYPDVKPAAPSPHPAGFVVPGATSPGYPPSGPTSPYNPSAPSAPSL